MSTPPLVTEVFPQGSPTRFFLYFSQSSLGSVTLTQPSSNPPYTTLVSFSYLSYITSLSTCFIPANLSLLLFNICIHAIAPSVADLNVYTVNPTVLSSVNSAYLIIHFSKQGILPFMSILHVYTVVESEGFYFSLVGVPSPPPYPA